MKEMEDRWMWLGSKGGIFSVSSLKSRIYEASSGVTKYVFHWSKLVPIKVEVAIVTHVKGNGLVWYKIPPIFAFDVRDMFSIYKSLPVGAFKKEVIHPIIPAGCWCLWQARNQSVFKDNRPSVCGLVEEVKRVSYMLINNQVKNVYWSWDEWKIFRMESDM
ncbi:hypothetical protein R6Q59_012901 [Mikania micrantha]